MAQTTQAFLDWGRWVAGCGNPACENAKQVWPGQDDMVCDAPPDNIGVCLSTTRIEWPENPGEVLASVAGLPPSRQHWRPTPDDQEQP